MAASTLMSMASLPIKSADIYLEFDESTKATRDSLRRVIRDLPFEVRLFDFRLDSFELWRQASLDLGRDDYRQILLFTNEDHILLPGGNEELEFISGLQDKIQRKNSDKTIMVPLSHFPEAHGLIPLAQLSGKFLEIEGVPLVPCQIPGGPVLVSQLNFQRLWRTDFTGGSKFVGLENPFGNSLRLKNGFYIPPRTELFRHFDSYGHVKLNYWPYNLLEPRIQITSEAQAPFCDFEYSFSSSLHSPGGNLLRAVASEFAGNSSRAEQISMALLKSGLKRPSLVSAKWAASRFGASSSELAKGLAYTLRKNGRLRTAIIRRIIQTPFHLALGLLGRLIKRSEKIDREFTWFLTYGSGVGFLKLLRLSIPNILAKARKNVA
jgi:hypothetical protein